MAMSQNFPQYFDGIVAGDPVYDLERIDLSEIYGVQAIYNAYSTYPGGTVPTNSAGQPLDYAAFPAADQALFETALLQKCDGLDGAVDGVIDNHAACDASFKPTTATYTSGGKTLPLQCPAAKDATCLLPVQIQAAMKINQGPRNAFGQTLQDPAGSVARDHVNNTIQGYVYDGGFMAPAGVPSRKIGASPTSTPGDFALGASSFGFRSLTPPNPSYNSLMFNFTTDFGILNKSTPQVTASTSLDIRRFVDLGHKIIWYHGHSDPGPPFEQTVVYYSEMAAQHGGFNAAQRFSRFYPIPNMGHCAGGPATDQFDLLTPLVNWVENGVAQARAAVRCARIRRRRVTSDLPGTALLWRWLPTTPASGPPVRTRATTITPAEGSPRAITARGIRSSGHRRSNKRLPFLPALPRRQVHGAELPLLEGVVNPRLEAEFLLFVGDGKPVLDQPGAGANQHLLEFGNGAEELLVFLLGAEPHHVLNARAVVPAAVEQHHFAGRGQMRDIALEIPLGALALGGRRESGDTADPRIETLGNALDHAALASGIATLEQDHHLFAPGDQPVLHLHQFALEAEQFAEVVVTRTVARRCHRLPGRPTAFLPLLQLQFEFFVEAVEQFIVGAPEQGLVGGSEI
jgi:Tannase and feruloyl esterase